MNARGRLGSADSGRLKRVLGVGYELYEGAELAIASGVALKHRAAQGEGVRMMIARMAGGVLGLLAWCSTAVAASAQPLALPTPKGFQPCSPADPVATTEAHVATKIGSIFLSCFKNSDTTAGPSATTTSQPQEYAFALAFPGNAYTRSDLDALLSKVKDQWRGFNPLSAQYKEVYTARLNDLLRDASAPNVAAASIKPALFAIVRPDQNYYIVTSARSYIWRTSRGSVKITKVNSDAVVLRDFRLIRLTVQRKLTGSADVEQVQAQIGAWAKAIARS